MVMNLADGQLGGYPSGEWRTAGAGDSAGYLASWWDYLHDTGRGVCSFESQHRLGPWLDRNG